MKASGLERLQGTDGVRRQVVPASAFPGSPLSVFLEKNLITEEFVELYCYAHVRDLLDRGMMRPGDEIVVGWDSRDKDGFYTSRAVSGISKGGGTPAVAGVLPTPGVALELVARKAAGAFMITASHNPKDQNGIKIFLAPDARKMLPEDDVRLTDRIYATDYAEVVKVSPLYEQRDIWREAKTRFMEFHLDTRNNWMDAPGVSFADASLIIDPAHGALAGLAVHLFRNLGFGEVVEVAGERNGEVNRNSGVAFLEGVRRIDAETLSREPGLAAHQLVGRMLEEGKRGKERLLVSGWLGGVAFDADGDRFYILVYDPGLDTLHVLSGDECAALQAEYLVSTHPEKYRGTMFVHSVESDINVAIHAVRLGFEPVMEAVGDKWILKRAIEEGEKFGIGAEETGHSIHAGTVRNREGTDVPFYAGNGLKGAINTLVAMRTIGGGRPLEFVNRVCLPFAPGFKKGAYVYYIRKELFKRNSGVWNGVKKKISDAFEKSGIKGFRLGERIVDNEPDMLSFVVERENGEMAGSIFARNSGTEDKISMNVRGPDDMEDLLLKLLEEGIAYLMSSMKNMENPLAAAEYDILANLAKGGNVDMKKYPGVDAERLLFEMEIKQKLIKRENGGYVVTSLGRTIGC